MATIPITQVSYEDDQQRTIDILNDNFRILEWLINTKKLDKDNVKAVPPVDEGPVIIEYGKRDAVDGIEFLYRGAYYTEPDIVLSLQKTNAAASNPSNVTLLSEPITGFDKNKVKVYIGFIARIIGTTYIPGFSISMHAFCTDPAAASKQPGGSE